MRKTVELSEENPQGYVHINIASQSLDESKLGDYLFSLVASRRKIDSPSNSDFGSLC